MKKLNNKGYLTVEIILAATIAFTIAFFLIEITVNFSNASDNYYVDTIFLTDKALITDNIKTRIQDDIDDNGLITNVTCTNNKCTITYENGSSELKYENNSIKYNNDYSKEIKNINFKSIDVYGGFNEGDYIRFVISFDNTFTDNNYDINVLMLNSEEEELGPIGEYITNLYTNNRDTTVINNGIEYQYAQNVKLMNDRRGQNSETTTSLDGGNIRYYGAEPNNYIDIGDRTSDNQVILWRIIGVFDGKVRIVRNNSIGNYAWDTSSLSINDGYGINEWSRADMMKILNPGYINNKDYNTAGEQIIIDNSLWYEHKNGTCHLGLNNGTVSCDFTSIGLSDAAKKNIVGQILYFGGFDKVEVFANQAYSKERGNDVVKVGETCSGSTCNDSVVRTLSSSMNVGLLYPSDFGYAVDFNAENCQGFISNLVDCQENWMKKYKTWTISPMSKNARYAIYINSGVLNSYTVRRGMGTLPVLSLADSAIIKRGKGTQTYPYKIK